MNGGDSESANGHKAWDRATLPGLPTGVQALLQGLPAVGERRARWNIGAACAVAGPALLVVGVAMVLSAPAAAVAGPTLTLAGAILLNGVVRRR